MAASESNTDYIGRFAPTPSGPLHYGSLIAATASYLDARHNRGRWLLRIDDLDTPRVREGAVEHILRTLEVFGLDWDGDILFQSERGGAYAAVIESLMNGGRLYRCDCPRRLIKGRPYPGTCRYRHLPPATPRYALRVMATGETISVPDLIQGTYRRNLQDESGDFVVRRSDGITAYHLAAVVDDDYQGVTHVVRGADLLSSTPSQVYLQHLLHLKTPVYAHFPVALDQRGRKIAKRDQAASLNGGDPGSVLHAALAFLGQSPPAEMAGADTDEILEWGIKNWDLSRVPRILQSEA